MNRYFKNAIGVFLVLTSLSIFFVIFSFQRAYAASVTARVRISVCGNQIAEYGEDCDNSDFKGKNCKSLGYDQGSLECMADCSFDVSRCDKIDDTDSNDNNDGHNDNDKNNEYEESHLNIQGQQPPSVVGRIEKDHETRTLEIENNFSEAVEVGVPETEGLKLTIKDSQGNNFELNVDVLDNQFILTQGDISIVSEFSVVADLEAGKIFILGPEGKVELVILPGEIFEGIRSDGGNYEIENIEIGADKGKIVYIASVKKEKKLLGLFPVKIPLKLVYSIQERNLIGNRILFFWKIVDILSF